MTLTAVSGIRVGHAEVPGGRSGCTVILGPFHGAVEVRGMATGTRELEVLSPHHLVPTIDGLLFTGGSVFGLAAADGVAEWLAERGEGFDTGAGVVPLVPAAVIFDLVSGAPRPGREEGRRAAAAASSGPVSEGRVGAGAGATVGKLLGPSASSPGGLGSASRRWGDGVVAALAVVNALGDVVDQDGSVLAGARGPSGRFAGSDQVAMGGGGSAFGPGAHTTLAVVATDLPVSRLDLGKLARMATAAFPRAISPVNTPFDGDVVFVVSTGEVALGGENGGTLSPENLLSLGVTARIALEDAIRRAVSVGLADAEGSSMQEGGVE